MTNYDGVFITFDCESNNTSSLKRLFASHKTDAQFKNNVKDKFCSVIVFFIILAPEESFKLFGFYVEQI